MGGINAATWGIAGLATFGVIARPWNFPEFIWAAAGALLLVLFNLPPWPDALAAAAKGTDVYLFLVGMMLLAEVARKEGCSTGWRRRQYDIRATPPSGYS
jgi:arsenical pump membrane protein